MTRTGTVVSCEHASNALPPAYAGLVPTAVLASHRGWDPGALMLAEALATRLDAPLHAGQFSRLLVDLNRSPHHPELFSEYSRPLDAGAHTGLLDAVYRPYRGAVLAAVMARRPCLHLSIHSFTPHWQGQQRRTDIGLLYDPARGTERRIVTALLGRLRAAGSWTVHRNQPYRGRADGHTTALRRQLGDDTYAGLEIEVNQRWLASPEWPTLLDAMVDAVGAIPWPGDAVT